MVEKRSVEIDIKIKGVEQTQKLESLGAKFENIANSVKTLTDSLGGLKSTLESIKVPQEFSKAIDGLKDLSKVGKMPDLDNVAKGFQKLGKIDDIPNLSGFVTELKKFKDIKVPNILNVAKGIELLTKSTTSATAASGKIDTLHSSLVKFAGITYPNIPNLVKGFSDLDKLNVGAISTKIKELSKSLQSLGNKGYLNNFATFAKDIRTLSDSLDRSQKSMRNVAQASKQLGTAIENTSKKTKTFGDRLRNYVQYRAIADVIMG